MLAMAPRLTHAAWRHAARALLGQSSAASLQGRPFKRDWYRHLFAQVRAEAVKTCPSLADFRDQDLRDTAVTWMAPASATIPEIVNVTGHSLDSATTILKHYLAHHPELADQAIAKMVAWYERSESA